MIVGKSISKAYGSLEVLKDIDINITKGEVVSIVGDSGAGKTTLLQILGTLDKPDKGQIFINNEDVSKLNNRKLAAFRNREIGFIFQFHHLLPEFTAFENVMMPAWIGRKKIEKKKKKAAEWLDYMGLADRMEHKPGQLSGGEQQRVAVARALINNPSVIFADEPSGNLDSKNANELHDLFFNLSKEFNQTIVIVTHNVELAERAHKKFTMKDGTIWQ
jgi:lipoprotein-releasing system ATP-binding protein